MNKIRIENSEDVAIVRLNNGVTNAVNREMVDDFSAALQMIKNEFNGMILAGAEKFFCIGLDLPELIALDRGDMSAFWYDFNQVILDLYSLPMPSACAIVGHGPGAGTIFALACDFRFVTNGNSLLGLNEIKLGLPTPYIAGLMLRQIVGDQTANDLLYYGEMIKSESAKQLHMINEIHRPMDVEKKAVSKIRELSTFPNQAFAAVKAARCEDVRLKFETNRKKQDAIFLDHWFSDLGQRLLKEALKHYR